MSPSSEHAAAATILSASAARAQRTGPGGAGDTAAVRRVAVLGADRMIVVSGGRDARVAAIAAHQRGRVSRRQLLDGGLTTDQIRHLVRSERLFVVLAGVYAVGSPAPVALGRETSALLAARPGALLSHVSAARLWGLLPDPAHSTHAAHSRLGAGSAPGLGIGIGVGADSGAAAGHVHVTVDGHWIPRVRGIHGHRSRILAPADRRVHQRLPICSPARVLLDLAAEIDAWTLERALNEGLIAGIVHPREISELLGRAGRHPGVARLRELFGDVAAGAGVTESEAEQRLRALLAAADLPRPQWQVSMLGYRLDAYWPHARFAAEVDGYRVHSMRRRFESDRIRDARLAAAGIEVMRITWRQMEREPLAVAARIAAALARRAPASPR